MPKISVIVPVYNSEEYLCKCLDSARNQSLKDIEIICIDDCSEDSSKDILEKYAGLDERIVVLHNEKNGGLSFSRNRAIENAEGEYVQFLDSDDYFDNEYALETLYTISYKNKLDLLKSGIASINNGILNRTFQYPECVAGNVYSGKELLYELELSNTSIWNSTSNFVRREFLVENKLVFYNGIIHEDVLYSFELYYYAKRAMCINYYTYVYVKHANSLTTQQKNIGHLKGYLTCMSEILKKDFMGCSIKFRCAAIKYFLRMYHNALHIRRQLNCAIELEMFDDEMKNLYDMFLGKSYVNAKTVIQNIYAISQSEKLYIYGAGKAAEVLLEILWGHDIAIDGVIVTDTQKSAKTLWGHRVLGIDDCNGIDRKAMFLVAITPKYVGDTVELLHSKGFANIIHVCKE